jgi:hypothetical protein
MDLWINMNLLGTGRIGEESSVDLGAYSLDVIMGSSDECHIISPDQNTRCYVC